VIKRGCENPGTTGRYTNTCYKCEKKGHPADKCPRKSNNDDDEKYVASAANNVKKLKKDLTSMKKAFTTVKTQLEKLKEANSDLSGSEDDGEQSHFQMDAAIHFAQVDKDFEPTIANLFKQARSSYWIASPLWICSVMQTW
jgi:hypothetical protein